MVICPGCRSITAGAICQSCGFRLRKAVEPPSHATSKLVLCIAVTAIAAIFATCAVVRPSDAERRQSDDYDRVHSIGVRHEACLRELSTTDSDPKSLRDAKQTLERVRSRADSCYHGRW